MSYDENGCGVGKEYQCCLAGMDAEHDQQNSTNNYKISTKFIFYNFLSNKIQKYIYRQIPDK